MLSLLLSLRLALLVLLGGFLLLLHESLHLLNLLNKEGTDDSTSAKLRKHLILTCP